MRTQSTAIRTTRSAPVASDDVSEHTGAACMRPAKGAKQELSSMRTQSTAIRTTRSASVASDDVSGQVGAVCMRPTKGAKQELSSMRTQSTAIRTTRPALNDIIPGDESPHVYTEKLSKEDEQLDDSLAEEQQARANLKQETRPGMAPYPGVPVPRRGLGAAPACMALCPGQRAAGASNSWGTNRH